MKNDASSLSATRAVARRTNRGRQAYVMKSLKNGLEIRLESRDELVLAKMLDLDPRGSQVRAQAVTFDLSNGDIYHKLPEAKLRSSRYYTPDLTDEVAGIQRVYEVKPQRFASQHEELFVAVDDFCRRKGMQFIVLSKEDFSADLLANVALLHQYARQCQSWLPAWADAVDRVELKHGHVRDVLSGLAPAHHHLMGALLTGVLSTNLHKYNLCLFDFPVEPACGSSSTLEVIQYA